MQPTMIFLVFVLSAIHSASSQLPNDAPSPSVSPSTPDLGDANTACKRSIAGIVWSCLTVIIACAWLSVHPNIPSVKDKPSKVFRRKLGVMLAVLLAPELVMYWAMRQWFGSRMLAKRYKGEGWTKTHGFFLLMGGFAIQDGELVRPLEKDEFDRLYSTGRIDFPDTTVEEIQDRSKADWLAKAIVLTQTSWFIVQCIARGISPHADLTKLEVLTLAFASLNAAVYFFWWNKPLDVRRPIRLVLRTGDSQTQRPTAPTQPPQNVKPFELVGIAKVALSWLGDLANGIWKVLQPIHLGQAMWDLLTCDMVTSQALRVPTFYAPDTEFTNITVARVAPVALIGVGFGALHFIAWNLEVPTRAETLLWRLSTSIISGTFLLSLLVVGSATMEEVCNTEPYKSIFDNMAFIFVILHIPVVPFYLVARLLLFALAFSSLRDLPPGAYRAIEWTSYLPHFG